MNESYDEESRSVENVVFEPARSLLIDDRQATVAHIGSYQRDLSVPGSAVPAAHVALASVAQTHRRRGLLSRLVERQLRDLREPVAVLWASEGRIYQRFGYELAACRLIIDIDLWEARLMGPLGAPAGRVTLAVTARDVVDRLRPVYDRVSTRRPGWSSRDDRWWARTIADPAARRWGAGERRALLYEVADGVEGYALWRARASWEDAGPNGAVEVQEVVAPSPAAYLALWNFLMSVDLTRSVRFPFGALDEPLIMLVDEPRRLDARAVDALWLRLADLPAALAARHYATALDTVFEVTDHLIPENSGRWRLSGDTSGAVCDPTSAAAEIACDVRDLAACYLGGASLAGLASAGRVREVRRGALDPASTAFGWRRQPSATEMF